MPAELARVPTFVERSAGVHVVKVPGEGFGGRWYKEDCDGALVALAWPEFFPREFLPIAARIAAKYSPIAALFVERLPANDARRGASVLPPAGPGGEGLVLTGSDRPADAPGQGGLF